MIDKLFVNIFESTSYLIHFLPNVVRDWVGWLIGCVVFMCNSRIRSNTRENFSIVLGLPKTDPRVTETAFKSVVEFFRQTLFLFSFYRRRTEDVVRSVEWVPRGVPEYIERSVNRGRGVILVTAHYGSWDSGGASVANIATTHVVQEVFNSSAVNEITKRLRLSKGMLTIPMTNVKRLMRVLRRGGVVAVLADRPVPGRGVDVEFFGCTTSIPAGTARLCYQLNVPIIAGVITRHRNGRSSILAGEPIEPDVELAMEEEIPRIAQAMMLDIEAGIRSCPEEWYMFRRMWPDR